MLLLSIWITGLTRSGKTTRLVSEFCQWVQEKLLSVKRFSHTSDRSQLLTSVILVFAANDDNRRNLADRFSISVKGTYPVICKTPLGFISDEVMLFWPLLFEQLNLKAQFPLRLRPETEQELATRLWRTQLDQSSLAQMGISEYRFVRQTLDLLQLAGASGIPAEDIPIMLEQGWPNLPELTFAEDIIPHSTARWMGKALNQWQKWCLERGLLSYGIIYELYWRYLLPNPSYQHHLSRRYQAVFADDVDDYPAIAKDLFARLLDDGAFGVFTYNPDGQVRLGLNADPNYLLGLASRCQIEELSQASPLATQLRDLIPQLLANPTYLPSLPPEIQSIQTTSRAQLLRKTAQVIIEAVERGEVQPEEIAIIAPGLDEIARYTLIEIISSGGVPIEPLNEQRPLISSPLIRALLTLLILVYPGMGRLLERDMVAEMLVVLSEKPRNVFEEEDSPLPSQQRRLVPDIDPVRAGLIADYCYQIDPEQPRLLPVETFARWDRLGYRATNTYQEILAWIEETKALVQQENLLPPTLILERAIAQFMGNGSYLAYERLAALRELMETAQHFWEVERRLRLNEPNAVSPTATITQFILLLRRGTISANPRPVRYLGKKKGAVTLATIFQYRSGRSCHRWQFWLDASSVLWSQGGAATLLGAPLFLRDWPLGRAWTPEDEYEADRERLERILRDLCGRVGDRIYLCHSDMGVNGTEQMGSLSILVYASKELKEE